MAPKEKKQLENCAATKKKYEKFFIFMYVCVCARAREFFPDVH